MFKDHLTSLGLCLEKCEIASPTKQFDVDRGLYSAFQMIRQTQRGGGIVYLLGNGGSAGIASHICNDLVKALQIPAQTLYDSNLLTCLANDLGYEQVFSYPLSQYLKTNDLVIAISSSGKSPNILNAAQTALKKKTALITLTGFAQDNPLRQLGHLNFWIGQKHYGLVETSHFFLLHSLIDLWNQFVLKELAEEKVHV